RLGSYLPVVVTERAGRPGGSGELAGGGGEVERRPAGLESEIVGAEQALEDLTAPGDPLEDLRWRERDVEEEADPGPGQVLPHHRRDQLQLVVVDPDDVRLGGDLCDGDGEPLVHSDVRAPPVAVEPGRADCVVRSEERRVE